MISPERLDILQTQWLRFIAPLGVQPVAAYPVFDRLVAAYTEPHRHYHNLEHIVEMLKIAGRLGRQAKQPMAVQFAVWFHDVVYDPRRSDNEERSADVAREELKSLGVPETEIDIVVQLIRLTAHTDQPADANGDVLLDADLAILAAAEARYRRYAAAIRQEYAHVPDAEYRPARVAVLERFLARPRIYRTAVMALEGETNARQNLRMEIAELWG